MSRLTFRIRIVVLVIVMAAGSVGAVSRVSKRLGVFELYGGYSTPTGNIDHLGRDNFYGDTQAYSLAANDVFKSSYTLGLSLGIVHHTHWYSSVGFEFSHLRLAGDTILFPDGSGFTYGKWPRYNLYQIKFNTNYLFSDIEVTGWSPYLGLGLAGGLSSASQPGYSSDNEGNIGVMVNFGAEVRIWQDANGRSLVTLASANSYEFAGSGYRPKYLTIGFAIKAYGRP